MAEAVVSFAVENIGNLLIEEAKFLWGVKGKVEDLQSELRLIQCLLRDADARQEQNHAVRESVAQLRDIAYDAEDVIERYILTVAPNRGQNIIKAYACFVAGRTSVRAHEMETEIEDLKSKISYIGRMMRDYGVQPLTEGKRRQARALVPRRTYAGFEEDFVGREDSIEDLVKALLNDGEKHRVIFIWGMGGSGKTALAKKVVARDEVKNTFYGFAWVCVSQEYKLKNILVEIIVQFIPDERKKVKEMTDDELFKTLCKIQQEKRCLVVLDNIWTKEAWDSLRYAFLVNGTRSKLLITTRNREVAEYIDPTGFFHGLRYLSEQESWDLLKKRAFPKMKGSVVQLPSVGLGVDQGITAAQPIEGVARQAEMEEQIPVITEDMKSLGYELLKKCGGLPLAIAMLGGLLAVNEWKAVYQKINLFSGDTSDASKVLALSYDDLPWHLKPCFLYLGSYPEDAKIPARKVLHMWIAEGFVRLNVYDEDKEVQVEDVAEGYLLELFKRGMIQVQFSSSGKVKTCLLHGLMRDFCVSKVQQESFLSIHKIQQDNVTEDYPSPMAIKVEETCKVRRLSLNIHVNDEEHVLPSLKAIERIKLHLRTLMFSGSFGGRWKQFQTVFINCKSLRVLKLEGLYWMSGKLHESVGDLIQLRLLSLAGSCYDELPQSMGNLVLMEFLYLDGVKMVIVPNVLWKMKRLRLLHLPRVFHVKENFKGKQKLRLDTLENLRTLKNFNQHDCDVKDTKKLFNLQKLTVSMHNKLEIIPRLAEFTLKCLQSLSFILKSYDLFTEDQLSKMSSCHCSCKLYVHGKIEKLPQHTSLPQQLKKLVLIESKLEEDPMPILEKLHHLIALILGGDAFRGKKMVCSARGFPQLKHLILWGLTHLEKLRVVEGAMPRLSRFGISNCPKLKTPPPREVPTYDCYEDVDAELMKISGDCIEDLPEEWLKTLVRLGRRGRY